MFRIRTITTAVVLGLAGPGFAAEDQSTESGNRPVASMEDLVVVGVRMQQPLNLSTDPKAPRQPLPAADGADYLKTIPGFSVIRKGGASGDPVFRGMAGSRLTMLVDGEMLLGGCGMRMDPPTAYVFPEAFDSIRVIKGPQSVRHGPGNSAGVVLFERSNERPREAGWDVNASLLGGSFDRHDEVLDATYSSREFTVRGIATNAAQGNYEDGGGNEIHSQYERWSTQGSLAWTPDDSSRYELSFARSDAEVAYADRTLDGTKFERENINLSFSKDNLTELIASVEGQIYYNYVDHVMDNYGLRDRGAGVPARTNQPDRTTSGGNLVMTLTPSSSTELVLGFDSQLNTHSIRRAMNMNEALIDLESIPRVDDAEFEQYGLFTEFRLDLGARHRLLAGYRIDDWQVTDLRRNVRLNMMTQVPNPGFNQSQEDYLHSGFFRYESVLPLSDTTFFAGLGHNERFPDYWEMFNKETATSVSALGVNPERTTQFDAGVIYSGLSFSGSASVFINDINDYLMIESGFAKPAMMGNTRLANITRNIDARSWGVELDGQYFINPQWRASMSLASVRGTNLTDDRHLPQLPPLEARLGLHYDNQILSAGLLLRGIRAQDRVDIGRGNIIGQDFGPTDSATVLSFNGGWRPTETIRVTAGVDNLLDEEYAEHISRAGANIAGFEQVTRVNEPGRTFWFKAQLAF